METLNRRCAKPENIAASNDVSIQTARCIGSCGLAPAMIYSGNVLARVTPRLIEAELERIGMK